MEIYGQTTFSMLANPVISSDSTSVLYNVLAQLQDDTTHYNYTELNGNVYLSTNSVDNNSIPPSVKCTDSYSGKIPSINSIVSAINAATSVSSVSGSADECATGNLFKIVVNGINFALCASKSTGFTMHNSDMDISVEYLNTHVDIKEPVADSDCRTSSFSTSITGIGKALLTGQPVLPVDTRKLKAAFDFSLDDSCSCKSKPRPCIFVHGLGIKKELSRNRDRFYYWGNLEGHAPCCTTIKYTYLNTTGNPWTSDTLQQKVCDRSMAVSETSGNSTIRDTIIVTHSMGNLMLAGALANEKCKLDSSSTWVGLAGPMKGSMCSDFIQDSCAGKTTAFLEKVADITGKCPPTTGLKSLPYQGQNHSSAAMDEAYIAAQKIYRENVYALMCGESYSGLCQSTSRCFGCWARRFPTRRRGTTAWWNSIAVQEDFQSPNSAIATAIASTEPS